MMWGYLVYMFVLVVGIGISFALMLRLWRVRHLAGVTGLLASAFSVVVWDIGYILEIVGPDQPIKIFWSKFEYLGISLVALALFTFSLHYSGRGRWLTMPRMIVLTIIPLITIVLAATNELHGLVWSDIRMLPDGSIAPLEVIHGGWFWVSAAFWYVLLLVTTVILAQMARGTHDLYRSQARIMLAGMLIPWVANILYNFRLTPFTNLDLTPAALTLTNVLVMVGFLRYRLLDVVPVAYEAIFAAMSDSVIVLDLKEQVVNFNPAVKRIFSEHGDRLLGRNLSDLLPGWSLALSDSTEVSLGPDDDRRVYSLRTSPLFDSSKRVSGRLLILSDITERKRAETQVQLQAAALDAAVNGIVLTDASGRIIWVNEAFTQLTGYGRSEALGNNPRILKSGRHGEEYYHDLWQTISSGRVWRGELINRRKDGNLYNEEMTITPLVQKDGQISHFIAIKQDISERKRAEQELFDAHLQAVEANRLKTQLLANVSHDLRTPLGAIIGYADMLHSGVYGTMSAEQENAAAEIMDSANQLLAFVNNMIGQAQIETGRLVLRARPFDPIELLDAAHLTASLLVHKRGLAFECQAAAGFPAMLYGDLYWLRQIVQNLVGNAVKFTEHGSVHVLLSQPDEAHWAIQVADTGPGIPEEARRTIFEAFRQVDGSATRRHGGSGLGLAIVRELVTLMGGTIELQSVVGQGSTFTVILPLQSIQELVK